jgi:hypothetical protein
MSIFSVNTALDGKVKLHITDFLAGQRNCACPYKKVRLVGRKTSEVVENADELSFGEGQLSLVFYSPCSFSSLLSIAAR